jgi:peptide chain release factor 1
MTQSAPADANEAVLTEHADLERQLSDPELHGDAVNARRVG